MKNKTIIYVLGAGVLLILTIFLVFFEINDSLNLRWNHDYNYKSKEPYGAWVFKELLEDKYGADHLYLNYQDTHISNIDTSGYLYIFMGQYTEFTSKQSAEILNFVRLGNEALFVSHEFYLDIDSLLFTPFYTEEYYDSSLTFLNKINNQAYAFTYYERDFDRPKSYDFSLLYDSEFETGLYESLISLQDSMTIYYKTPLSEFSVYAHTLPILFSNAASLQPDYLNHFNSVFDHFSSSKVILDHPAFSLDYRKNNAQSPIQYILSERSLRWFYYLLMLGILFFVVFRGKRKQRPIPTVEENKNTSLEFVDTLSQLHLSQNQNHKLVRQMSTIFYQKVKNKYYIDQRDLNFVDHLSKKSKIDKREIQIIIDRFENAEKNYEFSDLQLFNIHNRIESFFKNCQ